MNSLPPSTETSTSASNPALPTAEDVLAAERRIRDIVPETPTLVAHDLGEHLQMPLWLKAENLQRTGSFKARGATNWIRTASDDELAGGLVTVSAGNHAQALAWAARELGAAVTVVMPDGSSAMKIEATRRYGAEVIVHGTIQEAVALAHRLREERGLTLVHPYNDPRVMAGQGTVGVELLRQLPEVSRILCPIGGGGLISGIGIAVKAAHPDVELLGVEPAGAATMRNAWDHGSHEAGLTHIDTIAVSLAPAIVGAYTYAASRRYVDDVVTVGEPAIREATRLLLARGHLYGETGAAVGIAALLEGVVPKAPEQVTAVVVTGGNMDLADVARLI